MRRIEDILPIVRAPLPFFEFLGRTSELSGYLKYAPVIVGIFEGAGNAFVNTDIVWDVTEGIVIFVAKAAGRTDFRMNVFRAIDDTIV